MGRTRELALLDGHLAGEGPPLLLLAGEPGIGKSRLVREASRRGAAAGWRVLHGGCARSGGQVPYAPLLQALQGHLTRRAETIPHPHPPCTHRLELGRSALSLTILRPHP